MALGKPFRVHCLNAPEKFSILLTHRNKDTALLFENSVVAELSAPETQTLKKSYTTSPESYYGCLGVLQFHTGPFSKEDDPFMFLVMVSGCTSVGKICDSELFRITQVSFVNLGTTYPEDEKVVEVKRVLNAGTFYFSWTKDKEAIDLTLCEQRRWFTKATDNRFFWNRTMFLHMLRFGVNCDDWLFKMMCGSVEMKTVYAGVNNVKACIISRLSCERAGTRFNVRGTNDDGHVANFVETEQILAVDSEISSLLQTRGSVPLFWEQPGVQVGSHKVRLSRGPEASCSALSQHLRLIKQRYGRQVIVNLLGSSLVGSKEGEAMLSSLFHTQHTSDPEHSDIPHILFDYHQIVRGNRGLDKLEHEINSYLDQFGYYHNKDGSVLKLQNGTVRTNCLDCLDRTNCVQKFIGLKMLEKQLRAMGLDKPQLYSRFEEVFNQMWVNNGNEVSKIYAGTGAIQGGSKLMDGARSVSRTIQNNLLDQSKQEAIDILVLGHTFNSELTSYARSLLPAHYLHATPAVLRHMVRRWEDYTTPKTLRIVVGTYNVNGGKHFRSVVFKDLSLSDWLLDASKLARSSSLVSLEDEEVLEKPADIYAIGFQEIVDLSAGNIVAASSENRQAWSEELSKILNRDRGYVLLTSLQLVGVCLYVFVRPELLPHVRDVAADSVKTGMGGATGNKGAVAIRFVAYSTSICVVASHFAAGQSQVKERCEDYAEITRKILFPMARTLESHDYIFWCGDFNFRLDMDREEVKDLINRQEWSLLLEKDQLLVEKSQGNVFPGYHEGEIAFAPTYKYDLFSSDYDTSEKCRIPAWTDRVLWRRRQPIAEMELPPDWSTGQCLYYGRAELKQSDHRPVVSVIEFEAFSVDEEKRDRVFSEVIQQLGPPDGTVILQADDPAVFSNEYFDDIILNQLTGCGVVVLVRHIGSELWVSFKDGISALAAAKLETIQVESHIVYVKLKTEDWQHQWEREMAMCLNHCIPLNNVENNNSLLDMNNMSAPPRPDAIKVKGPPRPGPPSRPPPPRSPVPDRRPEPPPRSQGTSPEDSPKKERVAIVANSEPPPVPSRLSTPDSPQKSLSSPVTSEPVTNNVNGQHQAPVLEPSNPNSSPPAGPAPSMPVPPLPPRNTANLPPIPPRQQAAAPPPIPNRASAPRK